MKKKNTNNTYELTSCYKISTSLRDAVFQSYYEMEVKKLLIEANIFGLSVYCDGITIKTVPMINILAAGVHNFGCVLGVMNCSSHMADRGVKNATYIVEQMLPFMKIMDPVGTV